MLVPEATSYYVGPMSESHPPHPGQKAPIDPSMRCRLALVLTGDQLIELGEHAPAMINAAASGGDIASIVIAQNTLDETQFLALARPCVEAAQSVGIAAIIAGDPRLANRMGSDGIQYGQDPDVIAEAVERFAPKVMIGAGNVRTRHNALVIGELQPDYVMFGKPGGDTHDAPYHKNLDLGEWWSAMIEIPCIVMGGKKLESVVTIAERGVEFAALSAAIFAPDEDVMAGSTGENAVTERVRQANELLDQHAPIFEDAEG